MDALRGVHNGLGHVYFLHYVAVVLDGARRYVIMFRDLYLSFYDSIRILFSAQHVVFHSIIMSMGLCYPSYIQQEKT